MLSGFVKTISQMQRLSVDKKFLSYPDKSREIVRRRNKK